MINKKKKKSIFFFKKIILLTGHSTIHTTYHTTSRILSRLKGCYLIFCCTRARTEESNNLVAADLRLLVFFSLVVILYSGWLKKVLLLWSGLKCQKYGNWASYPALLSNEEAAILQAQQIQGQQFQVEERRGTGGKVGLCLGNNIANRNSILSDFQK